MNFLFKKIMTFLIFFLFLTEVTYSAGINAVKTKLDLSKISISDQLKEDIWLEAKEETVVGLMAQPIVAPRPKITMTSQIGVKAINDGKWISFRLRWQDKDKSEAGPLGTFSDAVAIEFPVKDNNVPPPIFMGAKDNPVHVFHWRAQYQLDKEHGMRTMKDFYPNMNIDMYPMEFVDAGRLPIIKDDKKEIFSGGKAAGNPQSYRKHGIDEILAEGFGTSAVMEVTNIESQAHGVWKNNEWVVIISRPLQRENGSKLEVGKGSFVGFAVWQGGEKEVGARKSITMQWKPLMLQ